MWQSAPPRDHDSNRAAPRRPAEPRPRADYSEAEVLSQLAEYKAEQGPSEGDLIASTIALWVALALFLGCLGACYVAWDTYQRQLSVPGQFSTREVVVGAGINGLTVTVKYERILTWSVQGKEYQKTWPTTKTNTEDVKTIVYYMPGQPDQGTTIDQAPAPLIIAAPCLLLSVILTGAALYTRSRRQAHGG